MGRAVPATLAFAIVAAACSSGSDGSTASTLPGPSPPPTQLCRRLVRLDDRLRSVRALSDTTASVARYAAGAVALDLAFRRMQAAAPEGSDIDPLAYANGRFGEIVRALPPELDGASARARVALILEAYSTAVNGALVEECGPGSVAAGPG